MEVLTRDHIRGNTSPWRAGSIDSVILFAGVAGFEAAGASDSSDAAGASDSAAAVVASDGTPRCSIPADTIEFTPKFRPVVGVFSNEILD